MGMRAAVVMGLAISACGQSGGETDQLQSSCVRGNLNMSRDIPDGGACYNFGYTDCPAGDTASDCVHYCAFDVCQSAPCSNDDDCAVYSAIYECQNYVVSGTNYGAWCGESDCPKGTQGCPCRDDGTCDSDNFTDALCGNDNLCAGTSNCPLACRLEYSCCGGALCGGDCIGTPCCS
jgi:hypothetical protein